MPKAVTICLYVFPSRLYLPIHTPSRLIYILIHTEHIPKAHIKSSLIGASVSVPITNGTLALGTWQGIWFLEFRNGKQRRKVVATVQGVLEG